MVDFGSFPSVTTPFAAADMGIQQPDVRFGITAAESCPYANGGTQISRHQMNGIGYIATLGAFLDRVGYPYGYQAGISYPVGAIVTQFDRTKNRILEFVNTVDENTEEPPTNLSEIEDSGERTIRGWTFIHRLNDYSFFPSYENRKLVKTLKVKSGNGESFNYEPESGGWVLVTRTISNWDELEVNQIFGITYDTVSVRLGVYSIYQRSSDDEMTIQQYEGAEASRFLPCPSVLPITVTRVPDFIKTVTVNVYHYPLET